MPADGPSGRLRAAAHKNPAAQVGIEQRLQIFAPADIQEHDVGITRQDRFDSPDPQSDRPARAVTTGASLASTRRNSVLAILILE